MVKMRWINCEGFENLYKVSESGKVFSVRAARFLKGSLDSYGYPIVSLHNKGYSKSRLVHRLVAKAFIPNPENKPQINHIDGNKQNNHVSNLEWSTNSENIKHAYALGLAASQKGTSNNMNKLSEAEVIAIKDLKAKGIGATEISKVMGLPLPRVKNVYYGQSWGWLAHETI